MKMGSARVTNSSRLKFLLSEKLFHNTNRPFLLFGNKAFELKSHHSVQLKAWFQPKIGRSIRRNQLFQLEQFGATNRKGIF